MYRIRTIIIFLLCYIFIIGGCDENPLSTNDGDNPNRVIGTYQTENVNKDEWGDFQLVLEVNKFKYSQNKPILTSLYFKNIGHKTITLDGILPYRNIANPPSIDIWSNDTKRFQIDKILDNLLNDNKIKIDPDKYVMLMQFDLKNVPGFILTEDTTGIGYSAEESENIGNELKKSTYKLQAHFHPSPQIYSSDTDTLVLIIE